jgi:3-oxosteroid 1-dehydrogenase
VEKMNKVIVVGSGAAGMAAVLAAQIAGASVTLVEADDVLGGTTAMSGGVPWVPMNHVMTREGYEDNVEDVRTYLRVLALGDVDVAGQDRYVAEAPRIMLEIEKHSMVRWNINPAADYQCDLPGARMMGRSLEVALVEAGPEIAARVFTPPYYQAGTSKDAAFNEELNRERAKLGHLAKGRGLIAGLLASVDERPVDIRTGVTAETLIMDGDEVVGLHTSAGDLDGRVIFAAGGFERNKELVDKFLRGPLLAPGGTPHHRGEALIMAMTVGADLGNMAEANWVPGIEIADEKFGGETFFWMAFNTRSKPGVIVVDDEGRRYANEAVTYNEFTKTMQSYDSTKRTFPQARSWLITGPTAFKRFGLGPVRDSGEQPWIVIADTLEELAKKTGMSPEKLAKTVTDFNGFVADENDRDFQRGSRQADRELGDKSLGASPLASLGEIDGPPYYAAQMLPGSPGTRGGPRHDRDGRLLRIADHQPIPGLYGAGNYCASIFGASYPGGGSTVGPALTFGWLAGTAAALD